MFVSDCLQLNEEQFNQFVEMGVFDALLDKDSNFFINVIRLKKTTIPEFMEAWYHQRAALAQQQVGTVHSGPGARPDPGTKHQHWRNGGV